MEVDDREVEDRCRLGIGIMDRLGGLGGGPEVEIESGVGENDRDFGERS